MADFTLHTLEARIAERAASHAANSYTRQLLDRGVVYCAKKFAERMTQSGLEEKSSRMRS